MANGNRITGIALATELRKLADAVEPLEGLMEFGKPTLYVGFNYGGEASKNAFLAFAKAMPKPYEKKFSDSELTLSYAGAALGIRAYIERDKVCRIIKPAQVIPAEYDCESVLSDVELNSL